MEKKKQKQEFILVEIEVFWKTINNTENSLNVQLRYQSPQSAYAIPATGWINFRDLEKSTEFPRIVYVPPFSGLEPSEIWYDDANVRKNVGKAQPGSVLRNLLFRVIDKQEVSVKENNEWKEIVEKIEEWFGVKLNPPHYEKGESIDIELSYKSNGKDYDIISGGSGFHQILTLMAFLYGYPGITTILFDEPDAHLHVNLQRKILNYFKQQKNIQFLIATHAEEFIKGTEVDSIISMLSGQPKRVQSTEAIIKAMSEVDNRVIIRTTQSPYILYLEGEDDERLLTSWAANLGKTEIFNKFCVYILGGVTKREMKERADAHFKALTQINSNVKRVMLFDYDNDETAFNPVPENPVLKEWKRKNIENYLLVPEAWKSAILDAKNATNFDLFTQVYRAIVDDFFAEQNLSLPAISSWVNIKANIFQEVNGKKILFESSDSLFHRIKNIDGLKINREKVSINMTSEFIHEDIVTFFLHLSSVTNES